MAKQTAPASNAPRWFRGVTSFFQSVGEKRGYFAKPSEEVIVALAGSQTKSGARVNDYTALQVSAVNACVGLLQDLVGSLPCKLMQRTAKGAEERSTHPAARAVNGAGDLATGFELRSQGQASLAMGGNAYFRVHRDRFFQPAELEWLKPIDVYPQLVKPRRFVAYFLTNESDPLTRADIVHVRGMSRDGVKGLSPIALARESIGVSLAQRDAAGSLVANGAKFSGILVAPPGTDDEQLKAARAEWQATQAGSANSGRTPVLAGEWKWHSINGMTMADAEFLESRRFELQEIARMYRIPPVLIGDSKASTSWGTGIEQMNLGFLSYCLNPILTNWEQSFAKSLLTEEEIAAGYFFRFNRAALLQASLDAQSNFLQRMRQIGVYSVNDCRRRLDENIIAPEIGDNYAQPLNNTGGVAAPAAPAEPAPTEPAVSTPA